MNQADKQRFTALLRQYNQCFYDRDIQALRAMYVPDGQVVYFDNHADCDSAELEGHLARVQQFFAQGTIVALSEENLQAFVYGEAACVIAKVRYASKPRPGVRASFFLERHEGDWKIRHLHFSTDPNEEEFPAV